MTEITLSVNGHFSTPVTIYVQPACQFFRSYSMRRVQQNSTLKLSEQDGAKAPRIYSQIKENGKETGKVRNGESSLMEGGGDWKR